MSTTTTATTTTGETYTVTCTSPGRYTVERNGEIISERAGFNYYDQLIDYKEGSAKLRLTFADDELDKIRDMSIFYGVTSYEEKKAIVAERIRNLNEEIDYTRCEDKPEKRIAYLLRLIDRENARLERNK